MADPRAKIHARMRGMVKRHFDNAQQAAKEMADFWHPTGNAGDDFETSDLSRKMSGSRRWTLDDAVALMSITGSRAVIEVMEEALKGEKAPQEAQSLLACAYELVKEHGEGLTALMQANEGGCLEEADVQLTDIIEAATHARAAVRAKRADQ